MSNETKILTGIGIATLLLVIGAAVMFGGKSTSQKEEVKTVTAEVKDMLVREDSHKKGAENGKVTIVEFGDFQCPACGGAHPIIKQLSEAYKDEVTFVFRHFPLPMHRNAKTAAIAAEAAGVQGKFFEMHDLLFENQKEWSESSKAMEHFTNYAKELGLDMEKFEADMKDKKLEEKIQKDMNDGQSAGVNSTPTFYINGEEQVGGLPYNQFKEKIEAKLK